VTTLTTTDHTVAALAALNAVLVPKNRKAYRLDAVSGLPVKPKQYVEVSAERRYMLDPRVTPVSSMRLWRITCYWVADTARNADLLEAMCHGALEGVSLPIGGDVTTPLQHEVTEPTSQDDDSTWSGYVDFTYAVD
jgi:hypothetical protein